MKVKLKRCPFCGSSAGIICSSHWSGGFQVICLKGCVRTKKVYNEVDVIELWNNRKPNPK